MTLAIGLGLLAVGTLVLKSAGPLATGDRDLPGWLERLLATLPAALLAALIAVQTLSTDGDLRLDARAAGVLSAVVAVALRAPFAVVVVVSTVVTGVTRALV